MASLESVSRAVAEVIGIEPDELGVDDDLFGIGLDSVAMMRLAGRWRRTGVDVSFADLAERPTLTAWWEILSGQEPAAPSAPQPAEVDEQAPFALTPVQHAYWVGRGDDQPLGGVGCHAYLEFDGAGVEPGRLETAVHALVARHAQLRARFPGDGTQVVAERGAWTGLRVHDLRGLDSAAADAAALAVRDRLSHRRLDVAQGQVFDVELTLLPGGATRVHLELDLLVADVLSLQILCHDLAVLYADPATALPPVGYGFARYLAELAAERAPRVEPARAYWQERLPELPGGPQLPLAVDPDQVRRPTFTRRVHRLSTQDTARLVELAAQHDLTPAMVLTTAYAEVLAAWSASPRFLLNLPLFDRQDLHPDVPHMVADFTNLVLLDVDLGPSAPESFAGRARAVQARLRANAAHAEYSAVDVLRDLAHLARASAPERSAPERTAPVVLASNIGSELLDDRFRASIGDLRWMISQTPQVWLDHQLYEVDGGLMLTWDAVEELFPAGVLDAMFAAYQRIVDRLATSEGWDRPLPALVPQEQLDVRERVNATATPESGRLLHDGFFAQAAAHPQRPAVAGALSYGELADAALRVAAVLRADGVAPGDAVAVTLPRGPGQVVAVLGVLAAGAVYVPVGVDQPAARRDRIHAAAGIRAVVDTGLLARAAGVDPLDAPVPVGLDDLAYVIFTSGSTGEPKGVEISHRAAVNTIDDVNRRFGVTADDRVLAVSALDFDLSVYDVFGLLAVGGAVVVIADDEWRDPDAWLRACAEHGVTVWNSVPALLDMLLLAAAGTLPASLRLALVSGDWVGLDLPGRLAAAGRCRLVALGGATEAAIWSNFFEVDDVDPAWTSIPYGHPLANQAFRVVDELGRDCPDWVAGELWIGGTGVARGYRGDPERTADRFVDGWYRTGDLGRYWPDGTLEFLGRRDQQVKVRGHRIELGEVEAALRAHPAVRQAVAAVTTSGGRAIAAAVTAAPGTETAAVLAAARDRLPAYMVPDQLHVLPELPLSANGKVDRDAVTRLLDSHAATSAPAAYVPPVGQVEKAVAEAWSAELGTGPAGRDADFFLLGGDSLTATRVVARLRAAGFDGVELAMLFRTSVLAEFAATITPGTGERHGGTVLAADPARRYEPFALTEVQRAYWLGRSAGFALGGVGTTYHMELDGDQLDVERLERAFHRLIDRHEMLRAVVDDDGRQRILPSVPPFRVAVEDAAGAAEASARIEHELARPIFDLTAWPLFAARAVHHPAPSGPRTRLGITLDYAVFDALSVKLVLAELATLYADPVAELPPVDVSFRDYVEHDTTEHDPAHLDADREYWSARLADLPPAPRLPLAVDPATVTAPRFTRRVLRVPADRWRRVTEQAKRRRLTPSAVLLSTYAEVLAGFSGGGPLSINLTLFDRKPVHPHIDHVLGDFTSLLLVAHHPAADEPFATTAHRVQHQLATDLEHRSVSSVWVQRELARRVGQADAAMPVVFTSTLGMDDDLFDRMPAEFPRLVGGLSQTPQVWLDQQVMQDRGDLVVSFDAVEQLFPAGVLDAVVDAYRCRIDGLVDGEWDAPPAELLPAEQRAVRERVNATAAPDSGRLLHDGFFAQATSRPERTAVAGALSYGELADSALRLAALLKAEGVAAGDAVAVTLPRGAAQVVAVLGVLAAGGVYVPVGVDQPAVRRERIHAAAGVRAVVDPALLARAAGVDPLDAPVPVSIDDLAYVIFTSGSTGEPKGVEITHRAAVNTIDDVNRRFGVTADDRVLAVSALDFDLSVYDIFGLLAVGGAVAVISDDQRRDPDAWLRACAEHGVTVWNSVPALLDMLLIAAGGHLPADLRLAMVSGDWVGLDLPGRLHTASGGRCRLIAMGGATEASIWSNFFEVDDVDPAWTSIPYGHPLANQAFRVVDELGRDCPDWVAGELWIGGTGVARGYRGDPERTADRFVDGWYRTGDLGRYWPDGTLEFLGRRDQQVKVRGHRIELGEIEAALRAHADVADAAAAVDAGRRRIVAAVVEAAPEIGTAPTPLPRLDPSADPLWVLEAALTEALLTRLASDVRLPAWDRWLAARGERQAENWAELMGRAEGTHLAPLAAHLVQRLPDLAAVVRGELDPRTLLDDPLLAPEAQAANRPKAVSVLAAIAAQLTDLAGALDRPLRVVELGGRTGRAAETLLAVLPAVEYVLTDPSAAMVAAARDRLGDRVRCVALPDPAVPDDLRHGFDAVLAFGALHREPDPVLAARTAALLLVPGGRLLAWEPAEPAPLSLLTVALLGDPDVLLDGPAWAEVLRAARLADVTITGQPPASLLLQARRPVGSRDLDVAGLRDWLTDRLPAHMIPEQVAVLPAVPLTANGKVDRAGVARLLDRGPGGAFRPPEGPVEQAVAALWAELLGADPVGRDADFFLLGGDSLVATRLVARLREAGLAGDSASGVLGRLFQTPVLAEFAAGLGPTGTAAPAVRLEHDPAARHDPFALTEVQQAYLLGRDAGFTLGGVGSHCYFEFDGDGIDPARLEEACNRLIGRHDMLRTVVDGDGHQRVLPEVPRFTVEVTDGEAALERLRSTMSHQVRDLRSWPLLDVRAVRYGGERLRIGISLDNYAFDGLSMMIFFAELSALYTDLDATLPPVGVTFRDHVVGAGADPDAQVRAQAYWRDRLPELPPAPKLPLAADPAELDRPRFGRRETRLPAAEWQRIKDRARAAGLTPSVVLLTCYAQVLSAWSERSDVTVNLTLFDRRDVHPDITNVIGDFTALLLVAHRPTGGGWLADALGMREQLGRDLQHRDVSAVWVQRELAKLVGAAEAAMPVVFTSALGLDDALFDRAFDAPWQQVWGVSQTPQVWLDHQVMEQRGDLILSWDGVEELFPAGVLDAMFGAYRKRLGWLATNSWDAEPPELLPDTQLAIRERVNATAAVESGRLLHEGFFARAAADPGRPAVAGELTYGELADSALRLAALLRADGAAAGDPVAVTLPRGPAQVVAVLGVLAAGGVYVPVGVDQPAVRRERIHAAAGIRTVVDEDLLLRASDVEPLPAPIAVDLDDLAYVIFTSGSTGEPKGVEITHRAAVNTIDDVNRRFDVTARDRVLAVSALDFDLSVYDVFGLLAVGGAIVVIADDEWRDPDAWLRACAEHAVTVWNSVPALLDMLLVAAGGVLPAGLRLAMVSGDWVGLDLPGRLAEAGPGCRLIAMGGATEASIWSNFFEVEEVDPAWTSIPYGRPLANQAFRVVDELGRDRPDWVAGELWIGGTGVARGYRGDPERTADRFVGGWYRTGDLGRYWPDGTLEFLGRRDQQVKVRGHRIELGEIEAALRAHPDVTDAVAVATGERHQRALAAFVTATPALDPTTVAGFLADRLPAYAVPGTFTLLDRLPLTANGKVDRGALTAAAHPLPGGDVVAPLGPVEELVAAAWAELLGIEAPNPVGRESSFFQLGGDSLVATRLVARLRAAGLVGVELRRLFETPTLAGFCEPLTATGSAVAAPVLVADPAGRHDPFPPTDVQRAYWLGRDEQFVLGGVGAHFYAELDGGDIDLARLEDAWNELIGRHDMLRAVFDDDGRQRVLADVPRFRIAVAEGAEAVDRLRADMSHQVLDPAAWPLFDVRAVRYARDGEVRTRIGVSLDNLLVDALSIMAIYTELNRCYSGQQDELAPVDVSFRDYVLTVVAPPEERQRSEQWWRERLAELPPAPRLPVHTEPSAVVRPRFSRRDARLGAAEWARIKDLAKAHDLTPSTVLMACYAEVLSAWSAQTDLTLNLTLFDRRDVHPDINRVLGDFTSLLLVPHRPLAGERWLDRARRLQAEVWSGLEHRDVSAVWVQRELAKHTGAADASMPVVFTSALGGLYEVGDLFGYAELVWALTQTPQVWLDHQVVEYRGELVLNWDAVEELFPPGVLDTMFAAYVRLVESLVDRRWAESVPDLLPARQREVRDRVNATAGPEPGRLLHEGFFTRAATDPGRPAIVGELSYGELADSALRLAAVLRAEGVTAGEAVAVTLPRGPGQVVAVLGILAAGAVYVPVGVDQPAVRRERIHAAAGVRVVVDEALLERAAAADPLTAPVAVGLDDLAYVIFTSGSTGEPKGVEISHRAAVNTIDDVNRRFGVTADDRVLAVSALDFDLSVYDVFGLLTAGGAVVLVAEEDRREATAWVRACAEHGVTLWNSVPALLDMLLVAAGGTLPADLRLAMVSGDWVGLDLPGRLEAASGGRCRLVAMGGATEASIWSNFFEVEEVDPAWTSIPYGRPLANQAFRVVDELGRDRPDWVAGELWIGGTGVARGYRGDPDRTADRFVDGWYRTGDLGRYWPDGTLEFLGRRDQQVKVRGHRIELGEIEAALGEHPGIAQARALAPGDRGQRRIVAVVVPADVDLDVTALPAFLADRLPAYALPAAYTAIDRLPLTANGKVDVTALLALVSSDTADGGDEPPSGPAEEAVAAMWAEVLDLAAAPGRWDNFFVLGGDSLAATRLVEALRRRHGVEVTLRQLFTTPTVAEIAALIDHAFASDIWEEDVV